MVRLVVLRRAIVLKSVEHLLLKQCYMLSDDILGCDKILEILFSSNIIKNPRTFKTKQNKTLKLIALMLLRVWERA